MRDAVKLLFHNLCDGDLKRGLYIVQIALVVFLQLWTATLLLRRKLHQVANSCILLWFIFKPQSVLGHSRAEPQPSLHNSITKPLAWDFCKSSCRSTHVSNLSKYHLEHHRFQGVDGIDMDVPSHTEAYFVRNAFTKSIWVLLQLFFYTFHPVFLKPKPPGMWELINFTVQIALDVAMVYFWGWKAFLYLILSTFVGGGMHPMAGHFISEHYVFNAEQETYSYYGPLNLLTWHVGYHKEHHDFPRIPGHKLHKVREIAAEFYENLDSYKAWSQVISMYIMDCTVGPFSRMKRKPPAAATKKSQ